ncbi:TRAP transporter large permease [Halomonas urumqiensis]|uniref:TRAP transporter large permease protein n=1 Tax=Halomonas urumqiensis TaxID=1684789 RepID=A0A2N7UMB1_9GAMM|nr:TRAP transporter large permease [Halomonas urumqiensis]PMR81566.1 C4-dicarboxylate ABC transporter permease [Halomonas urumqiensis]PTB02203.1 TRAP transporter large permease [Halomonas urumqiensis]GHE21663.1 ABC transporter permease [Halomonas urumqiensis]
MIPLLLLLALVGLIVIGAPVFMAMAGASLIHYWETGRDATMSILTLRMFDGMTSFTFLAIPLFLLAGEIMSRGGLTDRLMDLARALVGHFKAGLAQVNIASSLFFSSISGSAYADVAAMGPVMIPAMQKEGYPRGFAGALTAASATLSPLFPPSIVLIIYGSAFGVSIGALFAAGLTIALTLTLLFCLVTYAMVWRYGIPSHEWLGMRQLGRAFLKAAIPLGMPIIVVGGILGGFFTATEAASVAVAYGLVVTVVVYRTIRFRDLIPILRQTAITSAAITILVGVAAMFSYVVVRRNIPTQVVDFLLQITQSPIGIVALIILVLLIAGMFIDRNSNLLLLGPIIIPIFTTELGYSDVQTAMIIISALGVGHLTPPFGGTLLTASLVGKMSVAEISRYAWPFILIKVLLTAFIVTIPVLSEALPRALGFGGI